MTPDFASISVDLAREPDFSVGPVRVRPSLRQIESDGKSETLEPRVMQVLVALFQKRGEVIGRDELVQRCWAGRVVGEDAISRAIARVRKLGEAHGAFTLETIPKVGYRLTFTEVAVAAGRDVASTHASETSPVLAADALPAGNSSRPRRTWALVAAGAVVAFLAGLGFWTLQGGKAAPAESKIAVLPFEILSDTPEAVAVARTAPLAIANKLIERGQIVIPPSMTQQSSGEGVRQAVKLGATHVVEGYVSTKDGHVALTSRISGADGVVLWTCPLEARVAKDDLQTQAAAAVTYAFRWLNEVPAAKAMTPSNLSAFMRNAACSSVESTLADYEESRRAAEAAPQTPFMQISQIVTGGAALAEVEIKERRRILGEMREAYKRAMAVQPGLSTLRLAEVALIPEVDWAGRDAALRKAVDAPPRIGLVSGNYSNFLQLAGRLAEGETFARKHVAIEPTSPIGPNFLAITMLLQGRFEDANAETAHLIDLFPDNSAVLRVRFITLLISGDLARSETMIADPRTYDIVDPPAPVRPLKAYLAARKLRDAASLAAFDSACREASRLSTEGATFCVTGLAQTGRIDQTFALLDQLMPDLRGASPADVETKWLEHPDAVMSYGKLLMTPAAAALREDKRFIDVVERIGLLDFWKASGRWPDFCDTERKSVCAAMKAPR